VFRPANAVRISALANTCRAHTIHCGVDPMEEQYRGAVEDEKQEDGLYDHHKTSDCVVMILIWMVLGHSAVNRLQRVASSSSVIAFFFLFSFSLSF
jgi:hypothetical protein